MLLLQEKTTLSHPLFFPFAVVYVCLIVHVLVNRATNADPPRLAVLFADPYYDKICIYTVNTRV